MFTYKKATDGAEWNRQGRMMDLQQFAESDQGGGGDTGSGGTKGESGTAADTKEGDKSQAGNNSEHLTMTQAEYEKKLQAESDRRVEQALKTSKQKWEQEYKERIEKERADVERLAKLSAEEREKELFERNKQELTAKERVIKHREMKLQVVDELAKEQLPYNSDIVDMMIDPDSVENTFARIKWFKSWHREQIEAEVNNRLKSQTPKEGSKTTQKSGEVDMNSIIRGAFKK